MRTGEQTDIMKLIVNFHNFANVPKKKAVDVNASCEEVNLDCEDVSWGSRDANLVSEDVNFNATELIHMALRTGFSVIRLTSLNTTLLTNI